MKGVKHISPSSMEKFIACPAWWATAYDDELSFNSRTEYTDVGTIVHAALERFRDPQKPREQTYDELVACYKEACVELQLSETLAVFSRGLGILKNAYEIDTANRHLPMHLATTIAVEREIKDYYGAPVGMPPKWIRPMKGFIDRIAFIAPPTDPTGPGLLIIEDYKTGRAKSWAELTEEEIQPSSYLCWAEDILVPELTALGYNIGRIVLLWSYLDSGIPIPIQQTDIDTTDIRDYIGSIATQMVNFKKDYEDRTEEAEEYASLGLDALAVQSKESLRRFLSKHERVNSKCSWCPRKVVCENFTRQLNQEVVLDLTLMDLSAFTERRERYATVAKAAENARKDMDRAFRAYLDSTGQGSVVVNGETLWKADTRDGSYYMPAVVADILGESFVLNAASISKEAVNAELARLATVDPSKALQSREELERRMTPGVGARVVSSRKLKPAEKKRISEGKEI